MSSSEDGFPPDMISPLISTFVNCSGFINPLCVFKGVIRIVLSSDFKLIFPSNPEIRPFVYKRLQTLVKSSLHFVSEECSVICCMVNIIYYINAVVKLVDLIRTYAESVGLKLAV